MEVEFKFIKGAVEFCILHSAALLNVDQALPARFFDIAQPNTNDMSI